MDPVTRLQGREGGALGRLDDVLRRLARAMLLVAGWGPLLLGMLVAVDVAARSTIGRNIGGVDEIAGYIFAIRNLPGRWPRPSTLAATHVRIDFLLPEGAARSARSAGRFIDSGAGLRRRLSRLQRLAGGVRFLGHELAFGQRAARCRWSFRNCSGSPGCSSSWLRAAWCPRFRRALPSRPGGIRSWRRGTLRHHVGLGRGPGSARRPRGESLMLANASLLLAIPDRREPADRRDADHLRAAAQCDLFAAAAVSGGLRDLLEGLDRVHPHQRAALHPARRDPAAGGHRGAHAAPSRSGSTACPAGCCMPISAPRPCSPPPPAPASRPRRRSARWRCRGAPARL